MAGKIFVFDLDDTLIDNVHDYAEPILDTCKLIVKTLGRKAPHVDVIIALEHEIDSRRVKEINPTTGKPYLYSMERFPGTMVEVYREIAKRAKVPIDVKIEEELYRIGMGAFDESRYVKNIIPSVKPVLDYLKNKEDKLSLLTKGDGRVQMKKIRAMNDCGIKHFSSVYVVDQKTNFEFRAATGMVFGAQPAELRDYRIYSVGNSYSSDIKPALEAGFKGILIPAETWDLIGKMDDVIREAKDSGVLVLNDLSEIITRYDEL